MRVCERPIGWRWSLFSLLLSIILGYGVILLGNVHYLVVDDPLLAIIAGGGYGNQNAPYLMFLNILVGWLLQGLYAAWPTVPWYPVVLVGLECLAFWYAYMLARRITNRVAPILILGVIQLAASLMFTYTTVAAILAVVGLTGLAVNTLGSSPWYAFIFPTVLAWAGYLVRVPSFIVAALVTTAFLLFAWLAGECRSRIILIIALVAVTLLSIGAGQINEQAYMTNEHNMHALIRQNDNHRMVDYQPVDYDTHKQQFERMGWSHNDLNAYYDWIIADFDVYSVSNLGKLGTMNTFANKYELSPIHLARSMIGKHNILAFISVASFTLIAIITALHIPDQRKRRLFIMLIAATFGLACAGDLMLHVRQRAVVNALMALLIPALLVTAFITVVMWSESQSDHNPMTQPQRTHRTIFSGMPKTISLWQGGMSLLLALSLLGGIVTGPTLRTTDLTLDHALSTWMDKHPNTLVVTGSGMHYQQSLPIFKIRVPAHFQQIVKIGSWSIDGQRWYDQLDRWNVDPNHLVLDIARKDNLVYIPDDAKQLKLVITFIQEHTGENVTETKIQQLPEGKNIYRLALTR